MTKKVFRDCILLMAYCILLVIIIVKIDVIVSFIGTILGILTPFFIGIAIAIMLNWPNKRIYRFYCKIFTRYKESRVCSVLSIISVYLIFLAVLASIIYVIVPQFIESFTSIFGNLEGYYNNLMDVASGFIARFGLDINVSEIGESFLEFVKGFVEYISDYSEQIIQVTTSIFSAIFNLLVGLIFSIYLLIDKNRLKFQARSISLAYFPEKLSRKLSSIFNMSSMVLQSYIGTRLTEAFISGLFCFVAMEIFRFDYALFTSTIVAITALIPVFGQWIGCFVAMVVFLFVDPSKVLWFALMFVILKFVERNFVFRKLIVDNVKLPTLWSIFAVFFFGSIYGLTGMLIAIPITAVIYRLFKILIKKRNVELAEKKKTGISIEKNKA